MSDPAPTRAGPVDAESLVQALRSPASSYVEAGLLPRPSRLPLRMVLSTASAHRLPVAALFTEALQARVGLPNETAANVELALHEAVANAVIHGNLGIGSEGRDTADGLAGFCQRVSQSFADPAAGGRAVTVEAWWSDRRLLVAVTDEGEGFDLAAQCDAGEAAHGRGIIIMRAVTQGIAWNQRRRRLLLAFPAAPAT